MKPHHLSSRPAAMWMIASILGVAALHWIQVIAVPIAFSLFLIALVWPIHDRLTALTRQWVALTVSVLLLILVMVGFFLATGYGINAITKGLSPYAPRMHEVYAAVAHWLEGQGMPLSPALANQIGPGWVFGLLQGAATRINAVAGFLTLILIFLILGLLEVADVRSRLPHAFGDATAARLAEACGETAWKFRRYILVRTFISVLTGLLTWLFALLVGLDLAGVWGGLAFVLNYIPFIGPIIAVIPPVIFAFVQFEPWLLPLLVLAGMTLIQFSLGNLLEPRLEGRALAISPFVVVVSVFFWGLVWGIPGAFIGVPLTIAFVTVCHQFHETRWIARLLTPRMERQEVAERDSE
ncbi:AI-2E family transporter [Billgrantia endophytica]|nr:AI-2E family transporter [Halomonas endophytica]